MNIQIDCQERDCRNIITEKDGCYCGDCYEKLAKELDDALRENQSLKEELSGAVNP